MSDSSDSDNPDAGDISSWQAINTPKPTRGAIVVEDARQVPSADHDNDRVGSSPVVDQGEVRVQVEPPEEFDPEEFEDCTHLAEVVSEVRSQSAGLYTVSFEDGHVDKVRDKILLFPLARCVVMVLKAAVFSKLNIH